MTTIYEAAKEHFKPIRGDMQCIEVPEWNMGTADEPRAAKIYYHAVPTMGEIIELSACAKDGIPGMEIFVRALILMARDENDNRLFYDKHREELLNEYDGGVIMRVVAQMGSVDFLLQSQSETAKKT